MSGADDARGNHHFAVALTECFAAYHARILDPRGHTQDQDDILQAGTEDHGHGDSQDRVRNCLPDIHDAHHDRVEPSAHISGAQADQRAEHSRDRRATDPDQQRDARTFDQSTQDIAAEAVGAQPEVRRGARVEVTGRLQPQRQVLRERVTRLDEGCQRGSNDKERDDPETENRREVDATQRLEWTVQPRVRGGEWQPRIARDRTTQANRMRGSSHAYTRSATRLTRTTSTPARSTKTWMTGMSRVEIASTARRLMPG